MSEPVLDAYRRLSKEHGLRVTPQRTAIFRELLKAKDHPTADAVHRRVVKTIPNVSFDTVNRTLATFAAIGLIKVVEGYGQARRFDPDGSAHHHLHCLRCGRIIDFHNKDYDAIAVPAEITDRFKVTGKKVVLEGLCGPCGRARARHGISEHKKEGP